MKPLNEWDTRDLMLVLAAGTPRGSEVVAELLRREREQCAARMDALAAGYRALLGTPDETDGDSDRADAFARAADDIRGLQ